MKKRQIIILFLMGLFPSVVMGQDPFLSQFHMAPTFLSPSLAGSTGGSRIVTNYRNQWPGIEKAYQTVTASADMYLPLVKSGLGIVVYKDVQGSGNLSTTSLSLQYSYRVKLNRNWQFVPGVQFSYGQRKIDLSKLTYATDIIAGTTNGMSYMYFDESAVNYPDFSTSAFFFSEAFWFGFNADHLIKPNTTFLGEDIEIPMKGTLFGACTFWKERSFAVKDPKWSSFTFRYQRQNEVNQLDLGMYLFASLLDLGVWYRGVPVFRDINGKSRKVDNSAVVLSAGISKGAIHLGYSFDIPVSSMTLNGRGAHEVYMVIEMAEFFGFGDVCLSCLARRKGLHIHKDLAKEMKIY